MLMDPTGHFAISTLIILGLIGVGFAAGATTAGVIAYNNDVRGWALVGCILGGGLIGGAIGGLVGYFAGPGIAAMLASTGTVGGGMTLAGGLGALSGGIALSSVGTIALAGLGVLTATASGLIVMAAQWKPGSWPGDDPTKSPGDGFEWRGKLPVGGDKGAWYNPFTGDSLHPDLNHPQPIGPHWDWINKLKDIIMRIFS